MRQIVITDWGQELRERCCTAREAAMCGAGVWMKQTYQRAAVCGASRRPSRGTAVACFVWRSLRMDASPPGVRTRR